VSNESELVDKVPRLRSPIAMSSESLSGCQTNDKVGQFRLPIKSANKNLSSVMQKSA